MQTVLTPQIANILQQTRDLSVTEKQNLFWFILQTFGQENIFTYQNIYISNKPSYFISFENELIEPKPKRKLGIFPEGTFVMSDDFNEVM